MDDRYSNTQTEQVTGSSPENQNNKEWKAIRRERLINSLNRINFQNGEVILNFRHHKFNTKISLLAKPQPCLDHEIDFFWSEALKQDHNFVDYNFEDFCFTDGFKSISSKAKLISFGQQGVTLSLPEISVEFNLRKERRYKSQDVYLQLIQYGFLFEAELISFSAVAFSVNISNKISNNHRQAINLHHPVDIILIKKAECLYFGRCEILRQTETTEGENLVLKPYNNQIHRFKSKKYRSIRQKLNPSPNIVFNHPFTGNRVSLKVGNISGSGFSVEESGNNSSLVPGMIIPDLSIDLMNGLELRSQCQVVYRKCIDQDTVKCGFVLLDMAIKDKVRLASLLHNANHKNAHVCTKVDLDELWDFFFETGFIYPHKYSTIHDKKKIFKEIYEKLYNNPQNIAVNFIYRNKGKIYGHMSTVHFYTKTWLIHHHAALSSPKHKAGLIVLNQIGRFVNEFHRQPSTSMSFVACYFRPENKFPNLVFGGVARRLNDAKKCSLDKFAYISKIDIAKMNHSYGHIRIEPSCREDLILLRNFYENIVCGNMIKAFDLEELNKNTEICLNKQYEKIGLIRKRIIFSVKNNEYFVGVVVINISDFGLNLSELTNCIQFFVVDQEKFNKNEFNFVLNKLVGTYYKNNEVPALIYPLSYMDNNNIHYDKIYDFWVLNLEYLDDYFEYVFKVTRQNIKN